MTENGQTLPLDQDGYFYPAFGDGNTPAAIVGASVVLWVIHALLLRGIQGPRCSMPW